jgi:hypothetical protein
MSRDGMEITVGDYNAIYRSTRKNAAARKREFKLSMGSYELLVSEAEGCCQVTGIQFNKAKVNGSSRRPFYPSIDRLDNRVGYEYDNIRLVCVAYNIACNEWGDEVFGELAAALLGKKHWKRYADLRKQAEEVFRWRLKEVIGRQEVTTSYVTQKEFIATKNAKFRKEYQYSNLGVSASCMCKERGILIKKVQVIASITAEGPKYAVNKANAYPLEVLEEIIEKYKGGK